MRTFNANAIATRRAMHAATPALQLKAARGMSRARGATGPSFIHQRRVTSEVLTGVGVNVSKKTS